MPDREITYAEAIREALREEMYRDSRVFLMGEDIGLYGGAFAVTKGLFEEFGKERVIDTPISEAAIIGGAAGASLVGMRPVAEIQFSDFIAIGMDQLVNQAAKIHFMFGAKGSVPMVVHVPGLKVVIPSTPYDAKGLLKSAIWDDNPVVFLEHKLLYRTKGPVPLDDYRIPLGKADIKRFGKDLTIITYSNMLPRCLLAAAQLNKKGIEVEVLDLRSLRPLDTALIADSIKKTNRALVVYEAPQFGGFGAEIAAFIGEELFDYLDAPVIRIGGLDMPPPYNPNLEKKMVPQVEDIVDGVRKLVKG
ncbi:MAG: alpha-ketoacid dehydrogenase subunit beta [Candidatus Atribacteria bacterium]|nr:alpha-ketoacid dehydrogenase subunit beta [Candidatus Atribacteria bacterium]